MKNEDFEKFKKDKIQAEVLENKKKVDRLTIRSKAAKTIEKISGKIWLSTYQLKFDKPPMIQLYIKLYYRKILERSILRIENTA